MGQRFLIDTNILIYYFNNSIPSDSITEIDKVFRSSFNISVISKIEFLGWRGYTETQFLLAEKILRRAIIFHITDEIVNESIRLRRQKKIKTPDTIIAATCLLNNSTLVTRNISDFAKIDGLQIFNPFAPEQKNDE
ncbi:MAG: type II toxin-antitoxin system VapC family toxin [Calditrichaeota bacterium]|nr:type II toxin-antitoxin system VapC family toxin [Calditrichota bacterium]